jgi:hypothetical protein
MMSSFEEADSSEWTVCDVVLVAVDKDDVATGRRGWEENRLRRTEGRLEVFVVRGWES